ncbi:MAG TPA: HXXEE domain-containing protein [Thermaerobacter sp.]
MVLLIHDAEEILTVEAWMRAHAPPRLRQRFGHRRAVAAVLDRMAATTTARFATIVACLFVAVCAASYLALRGG